ncbi:MAG: DUF4332 domain-containing protein [Phycisphaeraceae bacterium]|nr:DUF4332 domain-containing protein [Phycisphaeraceae bacterium]
MANMKIQEIEGIGPAYGAKLSGAGITDTDTLLARSRTPKDRQDIAAKTGIADSQILKWANMADLFRIKGIGPEFAELLEAAGVDTVPELAQRNAANLAQALETTNSQKSLTRRVPNADMVAGWIGEAKGLARALEY